jgi:hypothetical protein
VARTWKISPGSQLTSIRIGRQQTEQSSIMECAPCEVSIRMEKFAPQCGQAIWLSTFISGSKPRQFEAWRVIPEIFQPVKIAFRLVKDVDHDVGVIEDDPLAHRKSIHGVGSDGVIFFQAVLDFTRNGFQVRLGGPGANQEKIGETGNAAEIEHRDSFGLLTGCELGGESGEVYGFDGGGFR